MEMRDIPFSTTNWEDILPTEHPGVQGIARWRTQTFGAIRVRMVEYSIGYESDHWCEKGHILLCLDGRLETELADGRQITLLPGMSYQVGDGACAHKSTAPQGARLFIVD